MIPKVATSKISKANPADGLRKMPKIEREMVDARQRATTRYYSLSGNTDYISKTSMQYEEMPLDEYIKWMAFNQKFFTASVISENGFSKGLITLMPSKNGETVKDGALSAEIPFADFLNNQAHFKYFFGPNKRKNRTLTKFYKSCWAPNHSR